MKGAIVVQSRMRTGIGRRMAESKRSVPHFYVETEVVLDGALALIAQLNAGRSADERITVTAAIVRASAWALAAHPSFNSVWTDGGLMQVDEVNVCVAVALDDGLIAPAISGADELSLQAISAALRDLAGRARENRLRPSELADGTFTVSNLGMFEVSAFTAIVTPPQVAVMATARPRERVIICGERPISTRVMTATLSADHRAVDGAEAARFLETFKRTLEDASALGAAERPSADVR